MKKISAQKLMEMEFLRNKSIAIFEYLISLNYPGSLILKQMYEVVNRPLDTYPLVSWRIACRDAESFAKDFRGVPGFNEASLAALLSEKFPDQLYPSTIDLIKSILKRGKVNSMEEAEMVNQFLGDTMEGDELFDRLEELGALLNRFTEHSKP